MDNKALEKELITDYDAIIQKFDDKYMFIYDFSAEFPMNDCYEVHDVLLKNKVVNNKIKYDHEHSCCYYYFTTKNAAMNFIKRLVKFLIKRDEIITQYGLPIARFVSDKKSIGRDFFS